MSAEPRIEFRGVSKCYAWRRERARSFLDVFTAILHRREPKTEFWALRDLSLAVAPGEAVGLIGPNGAGKSTSLKVACGVINPTSGSVSVRGRVGALLELAAGFHPDLTGRENIYLSGALMGLSRQEMHRHYEGIVAFADIGDFIDSPIRLYSSGMAMRLGFALASSVGPDVLLIDEVLAVGDRAFSQHCLERIYTLKGHGTSILFVSHDLEAVRGLCERTALLEQGQPIQIGPTNDIVNEYMRRVATDSGSQSDSEREERWGSGEVRIAEVWLEDGRGERVDGLAAGSPLAVAIRYRAVRRLQQPVFGLAVRDQAGYLLAGPNTSFDGLTVPELADSGIVRYRVPHSPLQPGRYYLSVSVYDSHLKHAYDHWEYCRGFDVYPVEGRPSFGVLSLGGKWELSPAASPRADDSAANA